MTNTDPDQIRNEIEQTRGELSNDVDALADKVRPSSIAHRQAGKVKGAFTGVKDRVMGTAADVRDSAADAPASVLRQAEGHPVAVGLIAFGVGLLASALIPSSPREQQLASAAKEKSSGLVSEVGDAAKAAASNLKEPAKDAVAAIKETGSEAVENVRREGSDAAGSVRQSGQQDKENAADNRGSAVPPGSPLI